MTCACGIEYEKPLAPECWPKCTQKKWLCKDCNKYMLDCVFAWNKGHGLKANGDPPGETRTVGDNWSEYHRKMGDYKPNPGLQFKDE